MSNMSYCRFENTYNDLLDCQEHLHDDEDLSEYESKYRKKLIDLCTSIAKDEDDSYYEDCEDDE